MNLLSRVNILKWYFCDKDIHSREHKHDSKVDGDDGLEEEGLEVDGDVAHDVEEHGG